MNAIKKTGMAAIAMGFLILGAGQANAAAEDETLFTRNFRKEFGTMKMMKMMDKDGDHTVTKEEFMNHMDAIFAMMDKNHDGKLDVKEFVYSKVLPGG
ncbi:MAG: hypothetical protein WCF44_01225 [Candidatus Methylophosphatis roskildensis]|nr:hypothetical protein [Sterolibacteriaceae bacterium]